MYIDSHSISHDFEFDFEEFCEWILYFQKVGEIDWSLKLYHYSKKKTGAVIANLYAAKFTETMTIVLGSRDSRLPFVMLCFLFVSLVWECGNIG